MDFKGWDGDVGNDSDDNDINVAGDEESNLASGAPGIPDWGTSSQLGGTSGRMSRPEKVGKVITRFMIILLVWKTLELGSYRPVLAYNFHQLSPSIN